MAISAISIEQERKIVEAIAKELRGEVPDDRCHKTARKIFNAVYDILREG